MLRLPEDDADASKHVGVLTTYKILLIYIYIYILRFLVWVIKEYEVHQEMERMCVLQTAVMRCCT